MIYFEQQKGEEIIEVIRKSLWMLAPILIKAFSLLIPAIYILLYYDISFLTIGSLGWLVFIFAYIFYNWLIWYYDVYILTTTRVIEIKQGSLFSREVNELNLDKIQDVSYSVDGFHSSFLGFGTVAVYSSGTLRINLRNISGPKETQQMILELKEDKK